MKYLIISFLFFTGISANADSIITIESKYNITKTTKALKETILKKKFSIFNEIDHQKGAQSIGVKMTGNKLIIFGNPKGGTPIMQENPLMGLELPLKILITEDEKKNVRLSYKDPRSYITKYDLKENKKRLKKIYQAIREIVGVVEK